MNKADGGPVRRRLSPLVVALFWIVVTPFICFIIYVGIDHLPFVKKRQEEKKEIGAITLDLGLLQTSKEQAARDRRLTNGYPIRMEELSHYAGGDESNFQSFFLPWLRTNGWGEFTLGPVGKPVVFRFKKTIYGHPAGLEMTADEAMSEFKWTRQ